jgi:large subunit ribosomal protein L25
MELVRLDVDRREKTGSAECRRLRRSGRIPAVLYGLARPPAALSLSARDFLTHFQRGKRMFELRLGALTQVSLLKDVGYDALGNEVVHIDFFRIDDSAPVEVSVMVEFVGTPAPTAGAIVEYVNRDVLVRCLPREVPERIEVQVGHLTVGQHIEVGQIALPAGVTLADPPHRTLVSYHYKAVEQAPAPAAEAPSEPIVLTEKKPKDGEDEKAAKPAAKK